MARHTHARRAVAKKGIGGTNVGEAEGKTEEPQEMEKAMEQARVGVGGGGARKRAAREERKRRTGENQNHLVEDRDTILELTGKIQELQNEINCMNDSRDFQDGESVRSGHSHVASQPVSFTPHPDPGGMLSRSLGMPSRNDGPPSIWDTHGTSGKVFAKPTASSSAPYPQEANPWISNVSEHTSPHVMSENQTPAQDQRCQSGPSARNSVVPSEGGFSMN